MAGDVFDLARIDGVVWGVRCDMVVADKFIWMHFPKCAGTELEHVLRSLNIDGAKFDPIDPDNIIWHHTLQQRIYYDNNFSVGNRDVVCCFRRLPYWILSRVHFEYQRGGRIPSRKMFVKGYFYENDGALDFADNYVARYMEGVTKWIRTEHLVSDFVDIFSKYVDLANVNVKKLFNGKNRTLIPYIKNLSFYFSSKNIRSLYASNPQWAKLEKMIYGNLLTT